jgi:hypothetical protein
VRFAISRNYEPNRLASNNLIDAYEKLLPRKRYKMKNKKDEIIIGLKPCLSIFRGDLK